MVAPADDRRVFLGRESPLVASAARWLLDRHGPDLGDVTVVVGGGRASRLLLGELVSQSEQRSLALIPGPITTPSGIPQSLGVAPRNAAGELARRLAWLHALQSLDPAQLQPLIPSPPGPGESAWARYAPIIQQASEELAWHTLRFADVRDRCGREPDLGDEARWRVLEALQDAYLAWLAERGLADPQLDCEQLTEGGRPVVLMGVLAMPTLTRKLVEQQDVTPLIHAPQSEEEGYSSLGLVVTSWWNDAALAVDPERITFADNPRDQADAALGLVAKHAQHRYVDEVTLGVCDPALTPFVERIAERSGHIAIRSPAGETIERSGPYRLLVLVGDVLRDRSYPSLAALVRHPDAERAMLATADANENPTGGWLDALDRYGERHLPTSLDDPWRTTDPGSLGTLQAIRTSLHGLLGGLYENPATPGSPKTIASNIIALLDRVYGEIDLAPDDPASARVLGAIDAVVEAIRELDRLGDSPPLAPADAIEHVLAIIRGRPLPAPSQRNAIEALGWLELLADGAPFLVLVGFNEGAVPSDARDDPILTDRTRAALGMETGDDRLARDAAILRSLVESKESLHIVVGRRSASNDPLAPSRLLFRGKQGQTLAIASRWISGDAPPRASLQPRALPGQVSAFRPAPVREFDQPKALPISSLRLFLESPYLFYLQHLLGLSTRADPTNELDAGAFGTLVHDALSAFGRSAQRDLDRPEAIEEYLRDSLATIARDRLGGDLSPTLRIQLRFADQTLARFALWQADRVREGWRISRAEWPAHNDPEHLGVLFGAGDNRVLLKGRIDRIDEHESTERIAILDYKTAMKSKDPNKEHRRGDGSWRDLQLPLYCHLARTILGDRIPELAYISLDAKSRDVRLRTLELAEQDFESADAAAREIIQQIHDKEIEALDRFDKGRTDDVLAWIAGIAIEDRSEDAP